MSENIEIKKGLVGVVADYTAVSKVMPETNSLTYRGYAVQDLCAKSDFVATAYLLLNGELPTESQKQELVDTLVQNRSISSRIYDVIKLFPKNAHPMDMVRTCVSMLGMQDPSLGDLDIASNKRKSIRLLAKLPSIVAAIIRHKASAEISSSQTQANPTSTKHFSKWLLANLPQRAF